jgi:hypothetical protein
MSKIESRGVGARPILRTVFVVLTAAYWLVATIPNLWTNAVALPFTTDSRLRVAQTYPGAADLRVGDTVDWAASPLALRLGVAVTYGYKPGSDVAVPIVRDGQHRVVRVQTVPQPSLVWTALIKRTAATVFVLIAAILLLVRPTKMLWGFYLLALGSVQGDALFWESYLPIAWWAIADMILSYSASVLGPVGLWMFASRFPQDRPDGMRGVVDRALIPCAIVLSAAFAANIAGNYTAKPPSAYLIVPGELATIAGLLCLLYAFFHLRADERQRLKWVVTGFAAYYVAQTYANVVGFFTGGSGWPSSWVAAGFTIDALYGFQIFIPVTVAYAILRHKVLDVNFVISRALVYGIVTSIIVGIFALVDWFFSKALEQQRAAVAAEVVVALRLGFGINAIHKFVDGIIDRILFRRRHLAERRLERAAAGIHHVVDLKAVDETLTLEPVEALGLTSAAAFRRSPDGNFERTLAVGWDGAASVISPSDPLVQGLHGQHGTVRVREVRAPGGAMPNGTAAPTIAVPLFVRHTLAGFVLFGQHVSGEDFDPEEMRLLERLAVAAASTYDHLDAEAARREVERLKRELANRATAAQSL